MKIFVLNSRCRKLVNSSKMQNDALMHHEGLKGSVVRIWRVWKSDSDSAGIDFTSVDVRTKVYPRTVKVKNISNGGRPITLVSKWIGKSWLRHLWFQIEKTPLVAKFFLQINSALKLLKPFSMSFV